MIGLSYLSLGNIKVLYTWRKLQHQIIFFKYWISFSIILEYDIRRNPRVIPQQIAPLVVPSVSSVTGVINSLSFLLPFFFPPFLSYSSFLSLPLISFLLVTRFRWILKCYIVLPTMKYKYQCNYFYNLRNWVSETSFHWATQYTWNSKPRLKDSKVHDQSILSVCFWYCSWSDCWKTVMCFGVY